MRSTYNGRAVQKLHTTLASDGAVIEFQKTGRDFWVTKDGVEKQCCLAARKKDDPDHVWWLAVREARKR